MNASLSPGHRVNWPHLTFLVFVGTFLLNTVTGMLLLEKLFGFFGGSLLFILPKMICAIVCGYLVSHLCCVALERLSWTLEGSKHFKPRPFDFLTNWMEKQGLFDSGGGVEGYRPMCTFALRKSPVWVILLAAFMVSALLNGISGYVADDTQDT